MKAFLDSSVIADATLKDHSTRQRTNTFLRGFAECLAPQYALKELAAGPIYAFLWFHNVLASERSYDKALGKLHRLSRTPRRNLTSSAIEALRAAEQTLAPSMRARLYWRTEAERADDIRTTLLTLVLRAWRRARRYSLSHPLRCHPLVEPDAGDPRGVRHSARRCSGPHICDQAGHLRAAADDLARICSHLTAHGKSEEDRRRLRALELAAGGKVIGESECRGLGDAVYAILSPLTHVIVTTNTKDHEALAALLGKTVERPPAG